MGSSVRPVPNAPALLIEPDAGGPRTLVVADVHLGLGGTPDRPEGPPEGSAGSLAGRLRDLAARTGAARLVIAGDVKHPIVGTPPGLRRVVFDFFRTLLAAGLEVDVVLGNHDVGLVRYLPREVHVHAATGAVVDGVGIFHGHTWPTNVVLRAPTLVVGHLHPGFRLAP
ncbi:metallophosphoesterase, partial [mine drainage metagenome]